MVEDIRLSASCATMASCAPSESGDCCHGKDTCTTATKDASPTKKEGAKPRRRKFAGLAKFAKQKGTRSIKGHSVKVFGKAVSREPMPDDLLAGRGRWEGLTQHVAQLPSNYTFEVHKSLWRIHQADAHVVALQFPEGLLAYSCVIADILETFAGVECIIMGDVTYGACCVDDYGAKALGADFLIHYGHSCLVPIHVTGMHTQYVFVDISFDPSHLIETIRLNFGEHQSDAVIALVGTIQFASTFHKAQTALKDAFPNIYIPQARPLSRGELLGCTSPKLPDNTDVIVYVADGRFHLESLMIHNASIPAYRYEPYSKAFTRERFDETTMLTNRRKAIERAKVATHFGLILGTLGRQGNPDILQRLQRQLTAVGKTFTVVYLSEIFPSKLALMHDVDAWIQVACPRLSIDWGYAFERPLLNSYEAMVALGQVEWKSVYPMDYYAKEGGEWSNYWREPVDG